MGPQPPNSPGGRGAPEFYTREWPTPEQVRETIDVLTGSACPTSEADIIDFLGSRRLHVALETRALNGTQVSYDFEAPRTSLTGQCYLDGGGTLSVMATFGGTRTEVESHLELYKSGLTRTWGEPRQEEGVDNAPRLAWHRPKHTLTLDAFWSVPDFSVLMLAIELRT